MIIKILMVKKKEPKEEIFEAVWVKNTVLTDDNDLVRELYNKTRYGEPIEKKKFQYALVEALFLIERGKILIKDSRNKEIDYNDFIKKACKVDPGFWTRYCVFRDLRKRGYIVKTALKFGADFRVYDRGVTPGEDHAKWVVFPVAENNIFTWYDFAAKNRVAHSTRKRLLLGIVDVESSVTFYEVAWKRP